MQQFTRTVARNSAFGLAAQIIIKVLSFAFSILIVRNLGVEAFGQYSGVIAFGMIFVFLADLGLAPYAVREVARWRDAPNGIERANTLYANLLALRLLLSILTGVVIVGVALATGRPLVMVGAIAINAGSLLLYAVQGSSNAMLSGFERLDLAAGANVVNQLTFVILGGAALWLGMGYYGLVISALLGVALMTLIYWRSAHALGVHLGRLDVKGWLPLLRASLPFGLIGLALGLSYKFDSFLLSLTRGDAETGYYNAAYNLVFSAVILSNVINTALYPSLSREAARGLRPLLKIYGRALRYLVILSLPIAVGTTALADQIVPWLFKSSYLPAVPALEIVIWVVPLMYASEFLGYVLLISGHEQRAARAVLVSTMVNVALNFVLVPRLGFLAAAVMTVVTEAVLVGQYMWVLAPQLRQLEWAQLLRPAFAALLMGMCVVALRNLPVLLNIAVAGLVYGILLLVLRVVGVDEWRFVISLRQHEGRATE
jgi:O-antigen/teichoic acid export membrane protein